ncbi:fructosamine kinase family protein [Salarchaeum japonicum]|uniref:Fructosamine kinase family protein n=1 Tax=Salarchaeum japonicum TaxID=555573 RepID=A0AAV3T2W1_9EURY|nr:fructosamine kinase family protein [Salarchaeum japonicum]
MSEFPTERVEAATDAIVVRLSELSGGEIGRVWRAGLDSGRSVAVKTGPAPLDVEARSLRVLADHGAPVPGVVCATEDVLVLDYVPGEEWTPAIERALGRRVARLHDHTHDTYGWPEPTWKGRFEQPNPRLRDWPTFFGDYRLRPVADAAHRRDAVTDDLHARVHALADDTHTLLPDRPAPRLLHGDLWRNNAVPGTDDVRALLDPAPWYGHHEVELAYADWSGLGDPFRAGYEAVRDIDPEFETRRPLYELYFALDHAYHFPGEDYARWAADRLDRLGY